MKDIDKEKTERLISTYYNHKPVLRALRDEFEKAGIVLGLTVTTRLDIINV